MSACLNATLDVVPGVLAGGADLTENTGTDLKDEKRQSAEAPAGRQMRYGIREHGMGGIMVGMARHGGVLPVGGTFFVFSDYMRGSVRLAALSATKCVFVWTHDSVGLGEDGPTHQPIEHLASLARDARAAHDPSCRCERDDAGVAHRGRLARADRTGPDSSERPGARRHGRRRGRTGRVRAVRCAPPSTFDRAHRHGQRGLGVHRRRSAPARRRRRASAWCRCRRGTSSRRNRRAIATPCCRRASRRCRSRRARHSAGSATRTLRWASTASVHRHPAPRSSIDLGINPAHVVERARALLEGSST